MLVAGGSLLLTVSVAGAARSRHGLRVHRDRAHAAIVNGTEISVEQAPWQVAVTARHPSSDTETVCSGSILDPSHILTAAHCVFGSGTNQLTPVEDFTVYAGTSDIDKLEGERRAVATVTPHPYYVNYPESAEANADDVAILTLEEPLAIGPSISPLALAPGGSTPAEGTAVNFTGFGEEIPGQELNGKLYSLGMTIVNNPACATQIGAGSALFLCASSPSGSPCDGDSGSGLTMPGSSPTLVGVNDDGLIVKGQKCSLGSLHLLANVTAPEIQDFLQGNPAPPRAPRGGGASCTAANPIVGGSMTCQPGNWSNAPTYTYTFIDGSSEQVLYSGASPEYKFSAAAEGSAVLMRLQAANAGGTGLDQTPPTAPIMAAAPAEPEQPPAPTGHVSLIGTSIVVQGNDRAAVKLTCAGTATCRGRLTLTVRTRGGGKKKQFKTTIIGTVSFSIAPGKTITVDVRLNSLGRALLSADHGRLSATLSILKSSPSPAQTHTANVRLVQHHRLSTRGLLTTHVGRSPLALNHRAKWLWNIEPDTRW